MSMPAPQTYLVHVVDADLPSRSRVAFFAITAKSPKAAETKALDYMTDEPGTWEVHATKHISNASEFAQRHATYLDAS